VCASEQKTTVSVTGGAGLQYYTVIMAQDFANRTRIPTPEAVGVQAVVGLLFAFSYDLHYYYCDS